MTTEEVKTLLKQGRMIDKEIKIFDDEYEKAVASAEQNTVAAEYVEYLERSRRDLYRKKNKILKMISLLEDGNLRMVIELRYIKCMTWKDIADETHYSWTSVFRFHKDAIKNIAEKT